MSGFPFNATNNATNVKRWVNRALQVIMMTVRSVTLKIKSVTFSSSVVDEKIYRNQWKNH